MLLGFKRRFAPFVEEGSKTHTIRAKRKIRPKVGEICHCYVDPRQKTMRLLGRFECVRVEDIRIEICSYPTGLALGRVWIEGEQLTPDEANALAWRDGFRSGRREEAFAEMVQYWVKLHPKPAILRRAALYVFFGDCIHWRYRKGTAKGRMEEL